MPRSVLLQCLAAVLAMLLAASGCGLAAASRVHARPLIGRKQEDRAKPYLQDLLQMAAHTQKGYFLEHVLTEMLASRAPGMTTLKTRNVFFIIMCSSQNKDRIQNVVNGWLPWAPHHALVTDAPVPLDDQHMEHAARQVVVDVSEYNDQKHDPQSYGAANLRHLVALKTLDPPLDVDWVALVDDDTFVNIPMLTQFVRQFPSTLPLAFGRVFEPLDGQTPTNSSTWFSGGGGILLSRKAPDMISRHLFEHECPLVMGINDVTIGQCCSALGVAKVHSRMFQDVDIEPTHSYTNVDDAGFYVTLHRIDTAAKMMEHTCTVARRFQKQHPKCNDSKPHCGPVCFFNG